MPPVVKGDVEG